MSKYIDSECRQCDEYINPYGCTNTQCPIRQDYEQGLEEMIADDEHEHD